MIELLNTRKYVFIDWFIGDLYVFNLSTDLNETS